MSKPIQISKEKLHEQRVSGMRELMKQDGVFDGRFNTRVEKSKTTYSRKEKYKGKWLDD